MTVLLEVVSIALIVVGALVFAVAGVGVLKLPDLYSRISAITTAAGVGVSLLILGALLRDPGAWDAVKAGVAIIVNLATAAVGGHALGRAGYLTKAKLSDRTRYDDLGKYGS